jgi:polyisoprenoid-binding protein YceI
MPRFAAALAGLSIFASVAAPAAAADRWAVSAGELGWTVPFSGNPLPGSFESFTSDITFSPDDLAGSAVTVTVQIASAHMDNPEQQAELVKPDWFNADAFPTATFTASTFRSVGGDAYEADGTLTIRDVSRQITLPFTFAIDGDQAHITGGTTVSRIDYGVGQGDWAIDDVIGFPVTISFDLTATRG